MANEIQTARGKIKTKLDILDTDTTFDDIIDDCIEQAVPRLKPFIQYNIAENTSVSLASGADTFDLPDAGSALQTLYIRATASDKWQELDLWQQNRNKIYLNESINTTMETKILATRAFAYSDTDLALLEADYPSAMLPLYYFAMSEFVSYIIGNKRKFNIYQQMNGVRTLDEMQELSSFYENRALRILEDEISAEGQ